MVLEANHTTKIKQRLRTEDCGPVIVEEIALWYQQNDASVVEGILCGDG
jgi:hypothetical protein